MAENAIPPGIVLTPVSRWPVKLPDATVEAVLRNPIPRTLPDGAHLSAPDHLQRASIVIVTFNNLAFNRLCLESVLANTEYPRYELIVVDNGSSDGTVAYLRELTRHNSHIRVLFNDSNLGFAAANNRGLAMSKGDILVLLNNDTVVPHGWLTRLIWHLDDQAVGLVGPVTNHAGNEAQIDVPYRTYEEFGHFAHQHTQAHEGEHIDIRMLAMFCVAMRRDVYEQIGALDEQFEVGLFEDEDYAMRVRAAGYRLVCAEDAFVHHFGQASIGKLAATGEYGKLFHTNRRRFEEKWDVSWEPHRHRINPQYQRLIAQIRQIVHTRLPSDATLIVISRGDDDLLTLGGQRAWHFPQREDGVYTGYYPADSAAAIAHLERLRTKGGQFLLLPRTAFWWLEYYAEFGQYLDTHYRRIWYDESCLIYELSS